MVVRANTDQEETEKKQYVGFSFFLVYHENLVTTVEPPRKGHFGTNINSSGLSPI